MEQLNGYDKEGNCVVTQDRKSLLKEIEDYSRKHGDAHLSVQGIHLVLVNSKNQLYIVQRGNKPENPFLFDKTVGGHVKAGDSHIDTVIRESEEELGVKVIISDALSFFDDAKRYDLCSNAVVKLIDFVPWGKSIRTVRSGSPWVKRDRRAVFIGVYDGSVEYKDSEAINTMLLTLDQLNKEIFNSPDSFTYDLREFVRNYEAFIRNIL